MSDVTTRMGNDEEYELTTHDVQWIRWQREFRRRTALLDFTHAEDAQRKMGELDTPRLRIRDLENHASGAKTLESTLIYTFYNRRFQELVASSPTSNSSLISGGDYPATPAPKLGV